MTSVSGGWYKPIATITIGTGATLVLHPFSGEQLTYAIKEIKARLQRKWGLPSADDIVLKEVELELGKLGYNASKIAEKMGDDRGILTSGQKTDKERKTRGDLAEILAAMIQEDIKKIPKEDVFEVFKRKITIVAPEHGTDTLAFHFDKSNLGIFPTKGETITFGESKYSSATTDLTAACDSTKAWILQSLTNNRLYAELTNIAEEYHRFGKELESRRSLGFIPSIFKRDEKFLLFSTILCSDSIPDTKVRSDVESIILDALSKHPEGGIPHNQFETAIFKASNLTEFCDSCYEGFSK